MDFIHSESIHPIAELVIRLTEDKEQLFPISSTPVKSLLSHCIFFTDDCMTKGITLRKETENILAQLDSFLSSTNDFITLDERLMASDNDSFKSEYETSICHATCSLFKEMSEGMTKEDSLKNHGWLLSCEDNLLEDIKQRLKKLDTEELVDMRLFRETYIKCFHQTNESQSMPDFKNKDTGTLSNMKTLYKKNTRHFTENERKIIELSLSQVDRELKKRTKKGTC